MKRITRNIAGLLCLFSLFAAFQAPVLAQNPDSVTIAGSFQLALGCAEDWMPACELTQLSYDSDGDMWMATFDLPAGDYEYKAALNGDWGENYGLNAAANGDNIPLSLSADTSVTFFYDHKTHWVTDNVNSIVATVPGDYQSEIGCPDDWRPECMASWLQDPDGDGIYAYTVAVPAGSYECKVAINRNWTENYGANGELDGANIPFSVGPSEAVTFTYNPADNILTITTEVVVGSSDTVTLVGSLQSEIGCAEDWTPDCTDSYLAFDSADGVWQGSWTLPAGDYEYKVALNNSWDEAYGANGGDGNIALSLAEETTVKFYYNPSNNYVTDNASSVIATVPGNYQSYLGCGSDWDPGCLRSWLQDLDGDGIYTFSTTSLPFGLYECKVAIDEGWDENYGANGEPGGANINFLVPADGARVDFSYDPATHVLEVTSDLGGEPTPQISAEYAIIHYYRADGDYGDHTTGDYNDFWGLHLWGEAIDPEDLPEWSSPKPFLGETDYGRFAFIKLSGKPGAINYIIHRGDVKDGTEDDRSFDPASIGSFDIWLMGGDGATYASRVDAQTYATIRYHRPDGDYGVDSENYWGLHLWGEAIDPAAGTDWNAPRAPDGVDDFGAYWNVPLNSADADASSKPLNFIVHTPGGDNTEPGGNREPGGDRSFIPAESGVVWLVSQDEAVHVSRGSAENYVEVHYHRPDGDYGDFASDDYTQFWGMHNWTGAAEPAAGWDQPIKPSSTDTFGVTYKVPLVEDATELAYILHKGDEKDPGPDQILDLINVGHEVWQVSGANPEVPYVWPIIATEPGGVNAGNVGIPTAYWLTGNTILWSAARDADATYQLHYAPNGGLASSEDGVTGGEFITLTPTNSIDPLTLVRFPHLIGLPALQISEDDMSKVGDILKGQIAVSKLNAEGKSLDSTGLQIPGVLDNLYAYHGDLGVSFDDSGVQFALWAPTAKSVTLHIMAGANTDDIFEQPMEWDNGVWRTTGPTNWVGSYYNYAVEVYVPSEGQVVTNVVTDPYSVGLSTNSERSYIMNLAGDDYKPAGWDGLVKPDQHAPEDITVYEMHVRDFSVFDASVPEEYKGKFKAFTLEGSNGMNHLQALQAAGLSHLHLLPAFDIATIDENPANRIEPDPDALAGAGPDSEDQQNLIASNGDLDAFNWGYDPYHYNVPEGSYATDTDGGARTLEFREMVAAVNGMGLRVVMDVVYNHTNASGQNPKSVLDKVVPGYYHRLDLQGNVERSTCCDNTASEHLMMEKLMVDSLVLWAKYYKVDSFRFDLMGHHMVTNMQAVQAALQSLTLENDGVDGSKIYIYGEGWNFGEVVDGTRGPNATQLQVGGLGIGTFSDRMRDAVRGGGPFDNGDALQNQGFANGLYYDPNDFDQGDQYTALMETTDRIRVELAGGLADYTFINRNGDEVSGSQVDYNGQPSGYTLDPQELISYVSKHDNQTLYDINVYGAPVSTPMEERVRMHNLGLSLVAFGQGIPFFHAGVDLLRSKSLDRDSFNSGDWFNRIDWTYQTNNFGVGLPVAEKNADNWYLMAPLLANPALKPDPEHITHSALLFRELLQIRKSSKLFRLETAQDIMDRVTFLNTGPNQLPGLIVMHISDQTGDDLDPNGIGMLVVFNANDEAQTFSSATLLDRKFDLHPVQADGVDDVVKTTTYNKRNGSVTIPGRTTAVMIESVPPTPWEVISGALEGWMADGTLTQRQGQHLLQLGERMINDGGLRSYFILSVNRYIDWGYLTSDQAAILLEAVNDL